MYLAPGIKPEFQISVASGLGELLRKGFTAAFIMKYIQ